MAHANGKANIAVVANCQGGPIAKMMPVLAPGVQIKAITVTHLARDEHAAEAFRSYNDCDFIFAQAVQDNYPTTFVTTTRLREQFGNKVITWPNIFYRGQGPEIRYITSPTGRVLGPLGEYQSVVLYEAWRDGLDVSATVDRMLTGGEWLDRLADEPQSSLQELRTREEQLDVGVSSHIAEHWQERRLFYTFNHPTNELLLRVACDLLLAIGIAPNRQAIGPNYREDLDRFLPATPPILAKRLGLKFGTSTDTKGAAINIEEKTRFEQDKIVIYPLADFVETTFRCLDAQLEPQTSVRIS
jgi:hypothetical protein